MKNLLIALLSLALVISLYFNASSIKNNNQQSEAHKDNTLMPQQNLKPSTSQTFTDTLPAKEETIEASLPSSRKKETSEAERFEKDKQTLLPDIYRQQSINEFKAIKKYKELNKSEIRDDVWATEKETSLTEVLSQHDFFSQRFASVPECKLSTCTFNFALGDNVEEYKKAIMMLYVDMLESPAISHLEVSTYLNEESNEIEVLLFDQSRMQTGQ
ncbi:hypothetical protein [Pleionea sp. CnH1-48]|uniref:hypothetical protein n=1 Tax=Pleionea sp. CnH1-48 TaxID=2954494 RepID=UPI0020984C10|nr:hypothetical protein [Pleionea sp. CnH1-48]MCO7226268.1 hypothetical protein [Pleionea sp. CnH1-48]